MEAICVKLWPMPGKIQNIKVGAPATIGSVLRAAPAELNIPHNGAGYEIRLDSVTTTNLDTPVFHNQTIMLLQALAGNS